MVYLKILLSTLLLIPGLLNAQHSFGNAVKISKPGCVEISNTKNFNLSDTDFTISVVVKLEKMNNDFQQTVVSQHGSNKDNSKGWYIGITGKKYRDPGKLYFQVGLGSDPFIVGNQKLYIGEEYAVSLVYSKESKTISFYINGEQDCFYIFNEKITHNKCNILLGKDNTHDVYQYSGWIFDFKIWKKAFGIVDIENIHNNIPVEKPNINVDFENLLTDKNNKMYFTEMTNNYRVNLKGNVIFEKFNKKSGE